MASEQDPQGPGQGDDGSTSSVRHLQEHHSTSRLSDISAIRSASSVNAALSASASSSLRALERLDQTGMAPQSDDLQGWTHSLPSSRRSSTASADTGISVGTSLANGFPLDKLRLSSLEQLQCVSALSHAEQSQCAFPDHNVTLPPLPSGSAMKLTEMLTKKKKKKQGMKGRDRPVTYAEKIRELVRCIPHLSNLEWTWRECRNADAATVLLLDFRGGALSNFNVETLKQANKAWSVEHGQLQRRLEGFAKNVTSRLVIIEDLSPDVIETLGLICNIDPEAFASQLSRGRPSTRSPVDDQDSRWITSGMATSNAFIQWYRPVRLSVDVASWLKDPNSVRRLLGVSSNETENDTYLSWFERCFSRLVRPANGLYGVSGSAKCVSQQDIHHKAHVTTNIFRRSWVLSTKVAEASKETVPTAWEERATIFKVANASVPTLVLFVDPVPSITDSVIVKETIIRLIPAPGRVTKDPVEMERDVDVFLPSGIRVPLKLPANKLNVSDDGLRELRKASEAASTATAVQSWLSTLHGETNPVLALLEVVRLDSVTFFDSLDACLKEISEDSLDDYLMTRRLGDWRQLLNDVQSKVDEISQSLHDFVDFVFDDLDDRPARVGEIVKDLDLRTQRFSQRIEKAYAALRAEMGLFESRRSIAEAETVTKLTELAFLFIPLTFCCGLFSMQVNELKNGVPLRTFIIAAIIVFVICYGARIVLRSSIIVESKQSAQEILWAAGKMKPGSHLPTRLLVWLTLKEAWKRGGSAATYLVFLFTLSFTVVPVAFLWTDVHLGSGLNIMVMLLLVPLGIAVAWACAIACTGESSDSDDQVPLAIRLALWISERLLPRQTSDLWYDSTSEQDV